MTASFAQHFFSQTFERSPTYIASAPARVNIIGEHTDYNGGPVLPIGIERRTYVAVRATGGMPGSRIVSNTRPEAGAFDAMHPVRAGAWWDYVAGVAHVLALDGLTLPQVEIAVVSNVPAGAGLSSSAALEVAAALALSAVAGSPLATRAAATIAWRAETEFVGVPCGIMDQFASALALEGNAVHIRCDTLQIEHVPCCETILIFDTGVPRELRSSSFTRRRAECEEALARLQRVNPRLAYLAHATLAEVERAHLPLVLRKRALHVVHETQRVQTTVAALTRGGTIPGDVLTASHESLRTLYECSTPELDWFVDRAIRCAGVRGARLTGAGWGGCAIATGEREALAAAAESITHDFGRTFVHTPRTWLTRAAEGARLEG